MSGPDITETMLLAYADARLPESQRAEVETWLAARPDRAAEVRHWQRQNEALTALFPPAGNDTLPTRLQPARIAAARRSRGRRWPQLAAAAIVLLVLGSAVGWFGRDALNPEEQPSERLIASAVTAHALYVKEKRHAVEVAATDREHLVTWLSNRLDRQIETPDLGAEGFSLVGGRLLPATEYTRTGPAAQLMYENAAAERLTVYVTAALPDAATTTEFVTRNELDAFYWANDRITCTVVGDLPKLEMQTVATKVYQQLTWRPDGSSKG